MANRSGILRIYSPILGPLVPSQNLAFRVIQWRGSPYGTEIKMFGKLIGKVLAAIFHVSKVLWESTSSLPSCIFLVLHSFASRVVHA